MCGRAGSIYEYQKNEESGKMELITVGTKMATEKELGYEPSLLIEMVKHRENGRIINRALIEKDRSDKLNGMEIDFPNFEKLKPHFGCLNIGGTHFSNMGERNSQDIYEIGAEDDGFNFEKKQREIECEEIKSLLITHGLDGQSTEAKQKRNQLFIDCFGTGSWTAIEGMNSKVLRDCKWKMSVMLNPELLENNKSLNGES